MLLALALSCAQLWPCVVQRARRDVLGSWPWLTYNISGMSGTSLLAGLVSTSVSMLGLFLLAALAMCLASRHRLLIMAMVSMSDAFVGPPRDLQPSLWDPPAERAERAKEKTTGEDKSEEKMSKRIRAVAIGSAGGIVLSLVVQSITPGRPRRIDYRRQVVQVPIESQESDFSLGSLTTGLLVGLGAGLILGSNSADEAETKSTGYDTESQRPKGPERPKGLKGTRTSTFAAAHAKSQEVSRVRSGRILK